MQNPPCPSKQSRNRDPKPYADASELEGSPPIPWLSLRDTLHATSTPWYWSVVWRVREWASNRMHRLQAKPPRETWPCDLFVHRLVVQKRWFPFLASPVMGLYWNGRLLSSTIVLRARVANRSTQQDMLLRLQGSLRGAIRGPLDLSIEEHAHKSRQHRFQHGP